MIVTKYVTVKINMNIDPDIEDDAHLILSDMDYDFKHPQIIDTEIVDVSDCQ